MQLINTKQDFNKFKVLQRVANNLRKQSTKYEKTLWKHIRNKQLLNIRFHRQYILLNYYIVDFYAPKIKLAIELDGKHHNLQAQQKNDIYRDNKLKSAGIIVKRYSNEMLKNNIQLVIKDLHNHIYKILK